MPSVLIVKNIPREGSGLLEGILKAKKIDFEIADLEKGQPFPPPQKYQAVIVLGGPDSANDQTPKMLNELNRVREILDQKIPYLGICLGLQVLVKAAGGQVIKSPVKEVGFIGPDKKNFTVELTATGRKDPLFIGLDNNFKVFQLHGETVELIKNMTLLGTGKFCQNQVVRVGQRAYGIQCHFELTPEMFDCWLNEDADLKKMEKTELCKNFQAIQPEYTKTGNQLLNNFLKIAGF